MQMDPTTAANVPATSSAGTGHADRSPSFLRAAGLKINGPFPGDRRR